MSKNYIYDTVTGLIEKYGTREPFELAQALGIKVIETVIKPLQGAFYIIDGQSVIFVEESLRRDQKLLVCAHEVGHSILHPDLVKAGKLAEFEVFDMRDQVEYEANIFASHLLIDENELIGHLKQGYTVFETAMMIGVNANLVNIKLTEMNRNGFAFDTTWGDHRLFD